MPGRYPDMSDELDPAWTGVTTEGSIWNRLRILPVADGGGVEGMGGVAGRGRQRHPAMAQENTLFNIIYILCIFDGWIRVRRALPGLPCGMALPAPCSMQRLTL